MNPLFKELGGAHMGQQNPMQQFQQFMAEMRGKNPNEEIRKLLQSGRISQQQLNEAQQMAQQMRGLFENFKR